MRAVLAAVLVATAALPSAAEAATVTVSAPGSSSRTLTVTLGGATRVTVSRDGGNVFVAARAGDRLNATSGCSTLDGGLVCGAESSFRWIVVNGSSGDDEIALSPTITRATRIDGNGGNDEIAGGSGPDTIDGDSGDDVISGGSGDDVLDGSAGADVLVGDTGHDVIDGGAGADVMAGGGQTGDTLDYTGRSAPVVVDLTRAMPQGELGENDEVDGFAVVRGGSGADALTGTDAPERFDGNGGADVLVGAGGEDTLNGGAGDDTIVGGAGADALSGGDGEDLLDARDDTVDAATTCGAARDRIVNDAGDPAPTDCEVVAPLVDGTIAVVGEVRAGQVLSALFSGAILGTESGSAWRWLRCAVGGCTPVGDGATYTVTDADVGGQLQAVLRQANEAGAGELASPPLGPVAPAPPPVPAAPAAPVPVPAVPAAVRVRSVRCSGRRCRVALTVTGAPAAVRVALTRGGRTTASATRTAPGARVTLTVKTKRKLARGRYRVRVTATDANPVTRTVRVRR